MRTGRRCWFLHAWQHACLHLFLFLGSPSLVLLQQLVTARFPRASARIWLLERSALSQRSSHGLARASCWLIFPLAGMTAIPCACLGIFLGGLLVKKLSLSALGAIRMAMLVNLVSTACYVSFLFLGCDTGPVAGVTVPYGNKWVHRELQGALPT